MLKIGITGGIGSGKTTVCKLFELLSVPVYYADGRAKWLMANDSDLIAKIKKLLGKSAYFSDGTLNRRYIADIVFDDKSKLNQLNALVHPAVGRDGEAWNRRQEELGAPYTLKEAAILFESKSHLSLDKVITVYAPEEMRIARVRARDGTDRASVAARIKEQISDEEKIELSDFVIYNDGTKSLIRQVFELHRHLLELAKT